MLRLSVFLIASFVCSSVYADTVGSAVSTACWPDDKSHVEATECIFKTFKEYESQLNAAEERAMATAKQFDADYQRNHNYPVEMEKAQHLSNDAFHGYMEAECEKIRLGYLSGNGAGDGHLLCKIDLMSQRLKRLK